jgi:two-component system, sensor histidine kinase and response regulator
MEAIKHILVVDDSVTNVFLIESVLAEYGYSVATALSADEADKKMAQRKPDLILLDLLMPQVSGYDFIKKIKAEPRYLEIPVIVVSAVTEYESIAEVMDLGAIEYVKKPVILVQLIEKIDSVLSIQE